MLDRGRGHIVVISSLQGKIGLPQRSSCKPVRVGRLQVYRELSSFFLAIPADSASKHALHGYFDSLRCELAPQGVQVTMVCPGYINTQLSANAVTGSGVQYGGNH